VSDSAQYVQIHMHRIQYTYKSRYVLQLNGTKAQETNDKTQKSTYVQWQTLAPTHWVLVQRLTQKLKRIDLTASISDGSPRRPTFSSLSEAPDYNKPEHRRNSINIMYIVNKVLSLYSEDQEVLKITALKIFKDCQSTTELHCLHRYEFNMYSQEFYQERT